MNTLKRIFGAARTAYTYWIRPLAVRRIDFVLAALVVSLLALVAC